MSDISALRLSLLGAFRIERGAQTIRLPTRKAESLLAYLVLHPEEHPREKLAALFWGDASDVQARHSLRTALNALRKQLGDEIFLGDYAIVQLNPDFPIWVDAREIQRLRDSDINLSSSQSLISLYQGDLLPDFYDDWILPEREQYHALYLDALLRLAQWMRSRSEYTRAIEFAQKVLASDPANERAHQQLMFCYAASGQRNTALKQYAECRRVLQDELAVEPARETTALHQWLLQSSAPSREAMITNLPIPLTSFIGRAGAMAEIKRLLARSRWVTLTGAGGSGKTRLAIQVATDLVDAFPDGVWWVELASLADESLVPRAVAQVLGVRESPSEPLIETVTHFLRPRHLLLALDNCEHVLAASAQMATTWLSAAANLKILATSREAHGVFGETVWNVPTLSVPNAQQMPPLTDLQQYESVLLLTERASAVKSDFALTPQNATAIAQICERLDGIPLAIELAAARVQVLPVEQIAARLDDRFGLLTVGSRTALPRHQTLRALIDWGYDLLSETERALLRRLSVFAGGFTLEAAEQVTNDGQVSRATRRSSLDTLSRLVDKSLIHVDERTSDARYQMLETIKQYGAERLAETGETETIRHQHALYFAQLAEQAEQGLRTPEMRAWLERMEVEHDNFRAALEWSLDHESPEMSLRFAGGLGIFWTKRAYLREGRAWLERLLARATDVSPHLRAKAMAPVGHFARTLGDFQQAIALDEASLAIFREAGDKFGMVDALNQRGQVAMYQNDLARARGCFAESLALCDEIGYRWGCALPMTYQAQVAVFNLQWNEQVRSRCEDCLEIVRELGDQSQEAHIHIVLGLAAVVERDGDRARAHLEQAVVLSRQAGDKTRCAFATALLGLAIWTQGKFDEALPIAQEGLQLALQVGEKTAAASAFQFLALIACGQRQMERSARFFSFCIKWGESFGFRLAPMMHTLYDPDISVARAALGEDTFVRAWAEGEAMSLERAVEYAMQT